MGILAWIFFGLIAGVVAKLIMPGDDPGGIIVTIIIGIVGALIGGFVASLLGFGGGATAFNLRSFLVAVGGAILLLVAYRAVRRA